MNTFIKSRDNDIHKNNYKLRIMIFLGSIIRQKLNIIFKMLFIMSRT